MNSYLSSFFGFNSIIFEDIFAIMQLLRCTLPYFRS